MSPLRRFWLSWMGPKSIRGVVLAALVLASLALWHNASARPLAESPQNLLQSFAFFMMLPAFFGLHLRTLLGSDVVILNPAHARWHLRVLFRIIGPALIAASVLCLSVLGAPLLSALGVASSATVVGLWLGFAPGPRSALGYGVLAGTAWLSSTHGWDPRWFVDACLAATALGIALAWQRLHAAPHPPQVQAWQFLARLDQAWNRLSGSSTSAPQSRVTLPGWWLAGSLVMQSIQRRKWRYASSIILVAGIVLSIFAIADQEAPVYTAITGVLLILACSCCAMILRSPGGLSGAPQRVRMPSYFTHERLLPLPRESATTVSLLSVWFSGLKLLVPALLGVALAVSWHTRLEWPEYFGFWMLLTIPLSIGAAMVLVLAYTIPRWCAVAGGILLYGSLPVWELIADRWLTREQFAMLIIASVMLLTWTAHRRLRHCELP
jgi:hypothetical protein